MKTKINILIMLFCLLAMETRAQQKALGYVFEDSNKNGKKDRNEKGIANVAVSNGYDVVLTDNNGKYELIVEDDNIIFVIKPSGYKPLVDDNNLPKFYYIHKPLGSPQLKYAGTPPTGKLPKSIDFPLTPTNRK